MGEPKSTAVEWTVAEAARHWHVSKSQVNKWREQGRVPWRWEPRFRRVLILDSRRPKRAKYGSLIRRPGGGRTSEDEPERKAV